MLTEEISEGEAGRDGSRRGREADSGTLMGEVERWLDMACRYEDGNMQSGADAYKEMRKRLKIEKGDDWTDLPPHF